MTIKDIFTVETFEQFKLSEQELIALKNVIELAKERLWMADSYPKRPEPSFEFDEDISNHDIDTCRKSIELVLHAVHKYNVNE